MQKEYQKEILNNILNKKKVESSTDKLIKSEESMDFTLYEHYKERINFHTKMLWYYLNEQL